MCVHTDSACPICAGVLLPNTAIVVESDSKFLIGYLDGWDEITKEYTIKTYKPSGVIRRITAKPAKVILAIGLR
jgi:hypothetical protein